ncbi:MAG: VWA domain-containing protein [Betaproteobacteria bacterium]|nr:MAG: VWA domain-containing protein [Betaproteobacteria bacterium]
MTLLWPRMLWLLAPLPVLAWAYIRLGARRRAANARLAGLSLLAAAATRGARLRVALPPLLFLGALIALIAAASRPQAMVLLPSMHKDVILALDTSGSMRATDVKPNRLSAAQSAARTFVESQPSHSRIGIVSFAGSASVVQSLTDQREDLLQAIERMQLQRGTALGSGIYIALATLLPGAGIDLEQLVHGQPPHWSRLGRESKHQPVPPGSNRSAAIVLLSDGESNHGPDPLEAAKLAADHGVRVYTVGIGSREGHILGFSGWSMRVRMDEDTLRKIAATTHGEYYAATSTQELKSIYEHLSARMVIERARSVEVSALLVGMGALLLAVSAFCSVLWFNRVL